MKRDTFFRFFILRVCLYFQLYFFVFSVIFFFGICLVFSTLLFRIVTYLEFNTTLYPCHLSLCYHSITYPAYLIYNTWNGLTVVHSSRKNGEVTKSHNHAISVLSWQGCAHFGFKLKKIHFGEFAQTVARSSLEANTPPCVLMCDLCKFVSVFMRDKLSTCSKLYQLSKRRLL